MASAAVVVEGDVADLPCCPGTGWFQTLLSAGHHLHLHAAVLNLDQLEKFPGAWSD